jgi:hypothetical protein
MRLRPLSWTKACLVATGALVIAGCSSYQRGGPTPIGYGPGTPQYGYPQPGYLPVNNPGGGPPIVWVPSTPVPAPQQPIPVVPTPIHPQPPETPVVLKPVPDPGVDLTPTAPVSQPQPKPPTPIDFSAKWVPWPLPPRGAAVAEYQNVSTPMAGAQTIEGMPQASFLHPESTASRNIHVAAESPMESGFESPPDPEQHISGINSTPGEDLRYRGGKILQNLSYVNLYLGGEAAGWTLSDVEQIDTSLEAALTDQNLNHVIMQYFNNQPIGTTARPSHPLTGPKPTTVSRGDLQIYMQYFFDKGYLNSYDLNSTIFNFLLPPGTILNEEALPANASHTASTSEGFDQLDHSVADQAEASDSSGGLGGYHGSIRYRGRTLYYSVEVYSERRTDGFANGIPVFPDPWKNICATLYHQVCEFRTDPDVEDAIRDPSNPNSERFLGWTSDVGEEIGDYPLRAGVTLKDIVTEVPLANGQGMVPVQLNYSNAVHGPEGPIPTLHPPVAMVPVR